MPTKDNWSALDLSFTPDAARNKNPLNNQSRKCIVVSDKINQGMKVGYSPGLHGIAHANRCFNDVNFFPMGFDYNFDLKLISFCNDVQVHGFR